MTPRTQVVNIRPFMKGFDYAKNVSRRVPPADVVGTDSTWVGRVRRSIYNPMALDLFVCGDNLRKRAALNTAQIAELLALKFTK